MTSQGNVSLAGVILVGGASSRMGSPKHLLKVGGMTLLERQVGLLGKLHASPIFVSVGKESKVEGDYQFCVDKYPDIGPMGGIASVLGEENLKKTPSITHVCVLAVDLPKLEAEFLQKLLSYCTPTEGVIPAHSADGNLEPLCAIYPVTCMTEATGQIERGSYAVRDFAEGLISAGKMRRYILMAGEAALLRNVNRPEDLNF